MERADSISAAVIYAGADRAGSGAATARSVVASLALADVAVRRIDVDAIPAVALLEGLASDRLNAGVAKVARADFVIIISERPGPACDRVEAFLRAVPADALAGKPVVPLRALANRVAPARAGSPAAAARSTELIAC